MEDDDLKHNMPEELRHFSVEFYTSDIERLKQGVKRVLTMEETMWKNNLNFMYDVTMS